MTSPGQAPPQSHERGGRRALDAQWADYLRRTGATGSGAALAKSQALAEGISQFNAGRFLESHETWEAAWREERYPERLLLLALAKIGAGAEHARRGNRVGASRLLADGLALLELFPPTYAGVACQRLRDALREWPGPPAPLPKIERAPEAHA